MEEHTERTRGRSSEPQGPAAGLLDQVQSGRRVRYFIIENNKFKLYRKRQNMSDRGEERGHVIGCGCQSGPNLGSALRGLWREAPNLTSCNW